MQELEARASAQLGEASGENQSLKKELARLEERNNQLQGYGLDDMSADQLSALIHGLTQVGCPLLPSPLPPLCRLCYLVVSVCMMTLSPTPLRADL